MPWFEQRTLFDQYQEQFADIANDMEGEENRKIRFELYRYFTNQQHGRLGKKNRKELPA